MNKEPPKLPDWLKTPHGKFRIKVTDDMRERWKEVWERDWKKEQEGK